mmetsp:Transcript_1751/g.5894  ORF Transcript_1751/g.5894 Transcript_1751/m.5894 type:complete len:279 (+) Transcript_1751:1042-1878(+)
MLLKKKKNLYLSWDRPWKSRTTKPTKNDSYASNEKKSAAASTRCPRTKWSTPIRGRSASSTTSPTRTATHRGSIPQTKSPPSTMTPTYDRRKSKRSRPPKEGPRRRRPSRATTTSFTLLLLLLLLPWRPPGKKTKKQKKSHPHSPWKWTSSRPKRCFFKSSLRTFLTPPLLSNHLTQASLLFCSRSTGPRRRYSREKEIVEEFGGVYGLGVVGAEGGPLDFEDVGEKAVRLLGSVEVDAGDGVGGHGALGAEGGLAVNFSSEGDAVGADGGAEGAPFK